MIPPAYAGHAGEVGGSAMMPHEVVGLIGVLVLSVVALAILAGLAVWRLRRIERRLRALEQVLAVIQQNAAPPQPRS